MRDTIFTIDMLPAANGDALWLRFGSTGEVRNILIDTGYKHSMNHLINSNTFGANADAPVVITLLVVTHMDQDHISGAITLIENAKKFHVQIENIWFNGYRQVFPLLDGDDTLGYRGAEDLSAVVKKYKIPLNRRPLPAGEHVCDSGAIMIEDEDEELPQVDIDGLTLTVLGPSRLRLDELRHAWTVESEGKQGERYSQALERMDATDDTLGAHTQPGADEKAANGSSIALLAEFAGKRILLGADAFPADLQVALTRLFPAGGAAIEFFKLSHHGSIGNLSTNLLKQVNAQHYLVSTNGVQHSHPDDATVQLILDARLAQPCTFHYNCCAPRSRINQAFQQAFQQAGVRLGDVPGDRGLRIDMLTL